MKKTRQNLLKVLKGQNVIFLENDKWLSNGLDLLEDFLKDNNINYSALFGIRNLEMAEIINAINNADVIVFQTQWVYQSSREISAFIKSMKDKKIVIEVPVGREPTWFYLPDGVIHDLYFLNLAGDENERECFYKITDKPYWYYKNKFDK